MARSIEELNKIAGLEEAAAATMKGVNKAFHNLMSSLKKWEVEISKVDPVAGKKAKMLVSDVSKETNHIENSIKFDRMAESLDEGKIDIERIKKGIAFSMKKGDMKSVSKVTKEVFRDGTQEDFDAVIDFIGMTAKKK